MDHRCDCDQAAYVRFLERAAFVHAMREKRQHFEVRGSERCACDACSKERHRVLDNRPTTAGVW